MNARPIKTSAALLVAVMLAAAPAFALTLEDVKQMVSVGVPDNIVVSTVANSETVFRLTAQDILDLKKAGISDAVIQALQATAGEVAPAPKPAASEDEAPRSRSDSRRAPEDEGAGRKASEDEEEPRRRSDDGERARPAPAEDDESEGFVRRRGGRRGGGAEEEDEGKSSKVKKKPKELTNAIALVREGKCLTATRDLYTMLEGAKYPEYEYQINYYLGDCFNKLQYFHTAQTYYQDVVKEGPQAGVFFGKALAQMVHISDQTRDPIYLVKQIHKIDPEDYPGSVKDDLYYYAGVRAFSDKDYNQSLRMFGKIGKSNEHYLQARYQIGVIYNQQKKVKQASSVFRDIIKADPGTADPETVAAVKQLALLNTARLYYGVQQHQRAVKLYSDVPRMTQFWPQAVLERAWAGYVTQDFNRTLGDILTIKSPYFDQYWLPEAYALEALTYYSMCEFKQVESILDEFAARYSSASESFEKLLAFDAKDFKAASDLYERVYGKGSDDYRLLPPAVFAVIEANREFAGPHNRILQIEAEMTKAAGQKDQWRDAEVAKALVKNLEKQKKVYSKLAGAALAVALGNLRDSLGEWMGKAELIRLEMTLGQAKEYEARFRNPAAANVDENIELTFATNPELIYWPFNNEYWEDELGYYQRSEPGACKE